MEAIAPDRWHTEGDDMQRRVRPQAAHGAARPARRGAKGSPLALAGGLGRSPILKTLLLAVGVAVAAAQPGGAHYVIGEVYDIARILSLEDAARQQLGVERGTLRPPGMHHVISEVYDIGRILTLEGEVDRIGYRDPHSFLHLRVDDGGGRIWSIELEGAAKLHQLGVERGTLRPGDRITVCGNPGRDAGQYRLLMLVLTRPSDGLAMRRTPMEDQRECGPASRGGPR